jgi:hypothetical protein
MNKILRFGVLAAAAVLALSVQAGTVRTDENSVLRPTGKGTAELDTTPGAAAAAAAAGAKVRGHGIDYHGGPIMKNGVKLYYIWYGNWSGNSAVPILTDFASNFGPSPYYNINTTYGDATRAKVKNSVTLAGSVNDNYSQGTALSDAQVLTVVENQISGGALPLDPDAIYMVLTSSDVNETSGFCTAYCGWHYFAPFNGTTIKYSFVGNGDRCPGSCYTQTPGPNGNSGADGMTSVIAHEIEEAATDPEISAWYSNANGMENGDKCAWKFGTTYTTANGQKANMKLGARDFLIQQNWVNAKNATSGANGYCDLKY